MEWLGKENRKKEREGVWGKKKSEKTNMVQYNSPAESGGHPTPPNHIAAAGEK